MSNPVTKLASIVREYGLSTVTLLIWIRIKSIFELLMPKTICGERIGLRSVKYPLSDIEIEKIYNWRRDEEILRWSGGTPIELSLEEFRTQLRYERWKPELSSRNFYIITCSGELIGTIFFSSIDWINGEGELGISLDKKAWGNNFGGEATNIVVQYIFTDLPIRRIYLGTFKGNIRAQKTAANCGFRIIGKRSHFNPIMGEELEGVVMELTRKEWFKQHASLVEISKG